MEKTRTMTNTTDMGKVGVRLDEAGAGPTPSCDPAPNYPLYTVSWPRFPQCGVCVATDFGHGSHVIFQ